MPKFLENLEASELITSRQNPLIAEIRKLGADRGLRRETGRFLCEGVKLVAEAIRWHAVLETLVVAAGTALPADCPPEIRIVAVPPALFKTISHVETPQGVLAVCRTPDLTPPDKLRPGRYLVLDGLQDPGNIGTIWRTADAFGGDGLFLVGNCADPFSPKTIRATMGAAFRLPVWETDLETLRVQLAGAGVPLFATALRADTIDVREIALNPAAVIIGSEGKGVSDSALLLCEKTLKIPMAQRCESLNAAVAASVILWEMYR